WDDLPEEAKNYVAYIEKAVGVPIDIISVGSDRAQTIIRRHPFA
ncbi:MAG: adenylosuccinate synthase, partial [Deltaproteobacteria bacterium]